MQKNTSSRNNSSPEQIACARIEQKSADTIRYKKSAAPVLQTEAFYLFAAAVEKNYCTQEDAAKHARPFIPETTITNKITVQFPESQFKN